LVRLDDGLEAALFGIDSKSIGVSRIAPGKELIVSG